MSSIANASDDCITNYDRLFSGTKDICVLGGSIEDGLDYIVIYTNYLNSYNHILNGSIMGVLYTFRIDYGDILFSFNVYDGEINASSNNHFWILQFNNNMCSWYFTTGDNPFFEATGSFFVNSIEYPNFPLVFKYLFD